MSQKNPQTSPATAPDRRLLRKQNMMVNLTIVVLLLLTVQGIASFFRKPEVLTNTTTRIVTNDSFIVVQKELARVTAQRDGAMQVADDRMRLLLAIAAPVQRATDSLLALQRVALEITDAIATTQADNIVKRDKLEALRLSRYNMLMERLEQVPSTDEMDNLLRSHEPVIFLPDTSPRVGFTMPPAKPHWQLQVEPGAEVGVQTSPNNPNPQAYMRGLLRFSLRKTNSTK